MVDVLALGPLFTPDDIKTRLGTSRSFVYSEIKKGRLRAVKVGRLPRVTEGALRDYLRSIGVTEADVVDGAGRPTRPEQVRR